MSNFKNFKIRSTIAQIMLFFRTDKLSAEIRADLRGQTFPGVSDVRFWSCFSTKLANDSWCLQLHKPRVNNISRACSSCVYMVLIGYDKEKHVYFNGFDEKAIELQRALVVPLIGEQIVIGIPIKICSPIKAPPYCQKSLTDYLFQHRNCNSKDAPRVIIMYYLRDTSYGWP